MNKTAYVNDVITTLAWLKANEPSDWSIPKMEDMLTKCIIFTVTMQFGTVDSPGEIERKVIAKDIKDCATWVMEQEAMTNGHFANMEYEGPYKGKE